MIVLLEPAPHRDCTKRSQRIRPGGFHFLWPPPQLLSFGVPLFPSGYLSFLRGTSMDLILQMASSLLSRNNVQFFGAGPPEGVRTRSSPVGSHEPAGTLGDLRFPGATIGGRFGTKWTPGSASSGSNAEAPAAMPGPLPDPVAPWNRHQMDLSRAQVTAKRGNDRTDPSPADQSG